MHPERIPKGANLPQTTPAVPNYTQRGDDWVWSQAAGECIRREDGTGREGTPAYHNMTMGGLHLENTAPDKDLPFLAEAPQWRIALGRIGRRRAEQADRRDSSCDGP